MKTLTIEIRKSRKTNVLIGKIKEHPEVVTQGNDEDELLENIIDAYKVFKKYKGLDDELTNLDPEIERCKCGNLKGAVVQCSRADCENNIKKIY